MTVFISYRLMISLWDCNLRASKTYIQIRGYKTLLSPASRQGLRGSFAGNYVGTCQSHYCCEKSSSISFLAPYTFAQARSAHVHLHPLYLFQYIHIMCVWLCLHLVYTCTISYHVTTVPLVGISIYVWTLMYLQRFLKRRKKDQLQFNFNFEQFQII